MKIRFRLDQFLVKKGLAETRSKAQALILAQKVLVNGKIVCKAGHSVEETSEVEILQGNPYVSRGGLKLESALKHFGIKNLWGENPIALDIGASTGGFSDCLLQHGIQKVYALDVGHGQLDWKLRNDKRVVVFERINIRHFKAKELEEKVDLIVIDVSFISILKFLHLLPDYLNPKGKILAMVKPQFEAEPRQVGSGGVIRDEQLIDQIVDQFIQKSEALNFKFLGKVPSSIKGAKGNQEFFCLLTI